MVGNDGELVGMVGIGYEMVGNGKEWWGMMGIGWE